ncbi:MAG TPA: hypothetical protein VNW15_01345 [Rhizomicrobium sp.]|jgi:hypothetical protein|nr:hypothetical protein [Rhizomicrobium sp.]
MFDDLRRELTTNKGAISRRMLFRHAATTIGGLAALLGTGLPAQAKMSLQAAGYQATPKGDQNCAGCTLFNAPASCTLIDGAVAPSGWCRFYAKKASGG